MAKRTDLAYEAHSLCADRGEISGVILDEEQAEGVKITRLSVKTDEGAKKIGKPIGNYINLSAPDIKYNTDTYETACKKISEEIRKLSGIKQDDVVLVAGLGNRDITPDTVGTEAVSQIMVTKHIIENMPDAVPSGMRKVCAVAPGVLGTTGMESVDIIKGISDKLKPDLIIVIDALAAADFSRISTTFQISDAGIAPGSGVGNNRAAFSKDVFGCPVIAVGVPTVVDARSICDCEMEGEPMMVTPRDIDLVIKRCTKTIANGINLALHNGFTLLDIEEYVG